MIFPAEHGGDGRAGRRKPATAGWLSVCVAGLAAVVMGVGPAGAAVQGQAGEQEPGQAQGTGGRPASPGQAAHLPLVAAAPAGTRLLVATPAGASAINTVSRIPLVQQALAVGLLSRTQADWSALARRLDLTPAKALEDLLGGPAMLLVADPPPAQPPVEPAPGEAVRWAVVTAISEATERRLREKLDALPREIVDGKPVLSIEAGRLVLVSLPAVAATRGDRTRLAVIAPTDDAAPAPQQEAFLRAVLANLTAAREAAGRVPAAEEGGPAAVAGGLPATVLHTIAAHGQAPLVLATRSMGGPDRWADSASVASFTAQGRVYRVALTTAAPSGWASSTLADAASGPSVDDAQRALQAVAAATPGLVGVACQFVPQPPADQPDVWALQPTLAAALAGEGGPAGGHRTLVLRSLPSTAAAEAPPALAGACAWVLRTGGQEANGAAASRMDQMVPGLAEWLITQGAMPGDPVAAAALTEAKLLGQLRGALPETPRSLTLPLAAEGFLGRVLGGQAAMTWRYPALDQGRGSALLLSLAPAMTAEADGLSAQAAMTLLRQMRGGGGAGQPEAATARGEPLLLSTGWVRPSQVAKLLPATPALPGPGVGAGPLPASVLAGVLAGIESVRWSVVLEPARSAPPLAPASFVADIEVRFAEQP